MSFPPQGGNGSVTVSTARECTWTAQASAGWIHLATSNGQGEGTIRFTVEENNTAGERGAAIRVSDGPQVEVRQAAEPPPPPAPDPAPSPTSPGPGPTTPTTPIPTPDPDTGRTIDLEGRVSSLDGSCPNLRFVVSGREVRTTGATEFKKMKCGDARNGFNVKVKGVVQADGSLLAIKVEED